MQRLDEWNKLNKQFIKTEMIHQEQKNDSRAKKQPPTSLGLLMWR